jgi:predicted lipoprotein with Yx(FWY)xxD motif
MKIRLAAISFIVAAIAIAHEGHDGKLTTINATVVDTGCYVSHNSTGEAHAKCAEACAKNGVPLAVLDEKGTLYMPIAVEHKDQNSKLMPFIEKKVKITGTVMEKGGMKGIAIKTVDLAQ